MKNYHSRLDVLDALRLVAALSVVFYHLLYRGWISDGLLDVSFDNYNGFFKYGYLGVQFFFVISGYMIAMSSAGRPWKKFLIGRFLRLYPAYWICISFTILIVAILDDGRFYIGVWESLLNYLMISKLFGVPFVDGAYWTLIYEIVFYFWVFLFLIFRMGFEKGFLIIAVIGWYLDYTDILGSAAVFFGGWFSVYFLVGLNFYHLKSKGVNIFRIISLVLGAALALIQAYLQADYKSLVTNGSFDPYISVFIVLFIFVFFAFVAFGIFDNISIPLATKMGLLSYPIYLLHQNIGYVIINFYDAILGMWEALMISIFVIVLLASVVTFWIEPRVVKFLRRWVV